MASEKPVLFHYPGSPYAHRVLWYIWLRGIAYDECVQPPYLPRPDLESIDVKYRRIPIMAVGKDIYCDSRAMIKRLEQLPGKRELAPLSTGDSGTRRLLENWTIDGGIFANTVKLMPYWGGLLQDPKFIEDRAKLSGGRRMTSEAMEMGRPDGLVHMRQAFDLLETTLLADGRKWILGTDGPSAADVDAVWPFEWLIVEPLMKGALPEEFISEKRFPKTYAYVRRFMDEVNARKAECPKPTDFHGAELQKRLTGSPVESSIIDDDPLQLKKGEEVEVYASDYGFTHRDRGSLVGLSVTGVVIRNSQGLHLHFPRWNFRIEKVQPKPSIPAAPKASSVPNMRLIYHPASPYSRKAFMVALELGISNAVTLQKVVVCPVPFPGWSDNNDEVAAFNPLAKIPCLVPDNMQDGIYDSRYICEYLENLAAVKYNKNTAYWQLHTLHACADGIMDAGILIAYEKRIREPKNLKMDEWITGQMEKINRGLDRLETAAGQGILKEPPNGAAASADEVAIAAAVGFMDNMGTEWRGARPKLANWFKAWETRSSFLKTPPNKDYTKGEAKM